MATKKAARKKTTPKKAGKPVKAPAKKGKKPTKKVGKATKKTPAKTAKPKQARRRPTARKSTQEPDAGPQMVTIQPMLTVPDVGAAIRFLEPFGFKTMMKMSMPGNDDVIMHAVLENGNGMIHLDPMEMPGAPVSERREAEKKGPLGLGISLYVMVDDVDKVFKAAQNNGVKIVESIKDQFWGDRTFMCTDPAGYMWWFAQNVKQMTQQEMAKAGEEMMGQTAPM